MLGGMDERLMSAERRWHRWKMRPLLLCCDARRRLRSCECDSNNTHSTCVYVSPRATVVIICDASSAALATKHETKATQLIGMREL